jgi:DNA-binding Lrp family transcriptional regulator
MSGEKLSELPKAMLANEIDPLDILILNELSAGKSRTTLADELKKNYNIELSRLDVEKRIDIMFKKGVLTRIHTIIVNPVKLFDHVFLNWWKLPLRPLLRRDELTWDEATKRILEISRKYGNMIMMLFTPEGEGEYDLVAFVCTNDIQKYYEFLEELTKEELLEKSKTQRVHSPSMVFFDPVILPSYEESKETYTKYMKALEKMQLK